MTRDDIIRMARDSGMELYGLGKDREKFVYYLQEFAALVAAAERKMLMQLFIDPENQPTQHGTVTIEYMQQEIAAEREACAKVCETEIRDLYANSNKSSQAKIMLYTAAYDCAAAIRAREQA